MTRKPWHYDAIEGKPDELKEASRRSVEARIAANEIAQRTKQFNDYRATALSPQSVPGRSSKR